MLWIYCWKRRTCCSHMTPRGREREAEARAPFRKKFALLPKTRRDRNQSHLKLQTIVTKKKTNATNKKSTQQLETGRQKEKRRGNCQSHTTSFCQAIVVKSSHVKQLKNCLLQERPHIFFSVITSLRQS